MFYTKYGMGLLDIIRSITFPPRPITMASVEHEVPPSDSGQAVSKALCLGYPPIRKAVMLVANSVASLPIHAIKYDANGGKIRDYDHPGYKLLNEKCSDILTPFTVKREIVVDSIFGNRLGYILRDEYAECYELLQINPDATTIEIVNGQPVYNTIIGQTNYKIPPSDIFHLRSLGASLLADPLCEIARNALGLSLSLQQYSSNYFKQGRGGLTIMELPTGLN